MRKVLGLPTRGPIRPLWVFVTVLAAVLAVTGEGWSQVEVTRYDMLGGTYFSANGDFSALLDTAGGRQDNASWKDIRASWFSALRRPSPQNNSTAPSSNCRFHCPICVGCTPNWQASSLVVRSPRTAANAALAFKAASIRRRFAAMPFSQKLDQSYQAFDSKSWSSFLGPL